MLLYLYFLSPLVWPNLNGVLVAPNGDEVFAAAPNGEGEEPAVAPNGEDVIAAPNGEGEDVGAAPKGDEVALAPNEKPEVLEPKALGVLPAVGVACGAGGVPNADGVELVTPKVNFGAASLLSGVTKPPPMLGVDPNGGFTGVEGTLVVVAVGVPKENELGFVLLPSVDAPKGDGVDVDILEVAVLPKAKDDEAG